MKNFPTFFWSEFNRLKDETAFVSEDENLTYWVWTREIQKLAVGLLDAGLETGERIGLVCNDRRLFFDYAFASWLVGAVVVPVPTGRSRSETLKRLSRTGCEWIVVDTKIQLREIVGADGKVPDTLNWIVLHEDELPDAKTDKELRAQGRFRSKRGDVDKLATITFGIKPEETALILSSFDGELSCASFSGGKLSVMMEYLHQSLGWESQNVALQLSLGWHYGTLCGLYSLLHGNALLTGKTASDVQDSLALVEPNIVVGGPAYLSEITESWTEQLSEKDPNATDPKTFGDLFRALGAVAVGAKVRKDLQGQFGKSLSRVYVVESPAPEGLNEVFEVVGANVLSIWGRPETGISHCEVPGATRVGSSGRPVYGYVVNLKKTKSGNSGQLQIRTDVGMDGYWKIDGEVVKEEPWLTLPIQARLESGFLYLEP